MHTHIHIYEPILQPLKVPFKWFISLRFLFLLPIILHLHILKPPGILSLVHHWSSLLCLQPDRAKTSSLVFAWLLSRVLHFTSTFSRFACGCQAGCYAQWWAHWWCPEQSSTRTLVFSRDVSNHPSASVLWASKLQLCALRLQLRYSSSVHSAWAPFLPPSLSPSLPTGTCEEGLFFPIWTNCVR